MRIERDIKLDYSDVLFRPKRSTMGSRSDVVLEKTYTFRNSKAVYKGIPIMAANMDGVGTFSVGAALQEQGLFTCLVKSYDHDDFIANQDLLFANHMAISTGITDVDKKRTDRLLFSFPDIKYVCIDVANGYSENFLNFVSSFREKYPSITIIAGNVVTPDITEELILRGADIVKVGIGPGQVCTTRIKTGVGYPQLSAVIECADAAHGLGGHIIADGGCSSPGDVAKAFGAGADFVMLGSMLAGTTQGGGTIVTIDGRVPLDAYHRPVTVENKNVQRATNKVYVEFYGMSSKKAQEKNSNVKDYRASEGRVVRVPFRGDINAIVGDILGGIRSTCTYCGAKSLKELPKRTTFVQVNNTHNRFYESSTVGE